MNTEALEKETIISRIYDAMDKLQIATDNLAAKIAKEQKLDSFDDRQPFDDVRSDLVKLKNDIKNSTLLRSGEGKPDSDTSGGLHLACVNARAFVESCGNLTEYVDGSKIAHRFKKFTIPVIEYNELRKAADDYDSQHVR